MFVFIGIIACLIGFLMIFDVWRFKGVADIGVVVFLIGIISIFICLMGVPVNAANGYPTAGISEVMIINESNGRSGFVGKAYHVRGWLFKCL